MRKFFTLVALLACAVIGMQATIVKEEKELTWFIPYPEAGSYNSETKVFSDIVDWGAGQIWYGDDYPLDADGYAYLGLDLASAAANLVSVTVEYTDASGLASQKMYIKVGCTTNLLPLDGRYIKKIEVKNYSDVVDATIAMSKLYLANIIGEQHKTEVWTGEKSLDWNWDNRHIIHKAEVASLHVGDMIEISYVGDETSDHKFEVYHEWSNDYPAFAAGQVYIGGANATGSIRFVVMEESDLTTMQAEDGFYLKGEHITITKVSTICNEVAWTGEQVMDHGWNNYIEVSADKFNSIQVGNILCFHVSALQEWGQIYLQYNDQESWKDILPVTNYVFQWSDAAPMIVEFPITHKMAQQLKGNSLIVKGNDYTLTDVYIKTGTPVNTVAAYLNVTAAGMATLVLPFNVPVLPNGVKAYRLTNDGSNVIDATEVSELTADKPVLIVASEGEYEFISEDDASDDVSGKTETYQDGVLVGTYVGLDPVPESSEPIFNYVLQNGVEGVGFYKVTAADCTLAPYRAYLSCGYNAMAGGSSAPMRIRFREDTTTGVENVQAATNVQKMLIDGQLYILRDGVTYTVQGQIVK